MNNIWICPKCETKNEECSTCVVCGLTYENAIELREKMHPVDESEKNKDNLATEHEKKHAYNDNGEINNISSKLDKLSIVSIILGLISVLFAISIHNVLTGIFSIASIITGILSCEQKVSTKSIIGIIIGSVGLIFMLVINIFII